MKKSGAIICLALSICLIGCSDKTISVTDDKNIETFDTKRAKEEMSSISQNIEEYNVVNIYKTSDKSDREQTVAEVAYNNEEQTEFDKKLEKVKETGFSKDELELMDEVNHRMSDVSDSKTFKEAHLQDRYIMMNNLLTKLQEEELIKDLSYDEVNFLFSFKYANGISGGMLIKDFSTHMN